MMALLMSVSGALAQGFRASKTVGTDAEFKYNIICRGSSIFVGSTTNATTAQSPSSDYGVFAFYAADGYTNGYFIYSVSEEKWVTYVAGTSYSEGTNRISLVTDKPTVPWNIAADNTDNNYYDIRAFKTDKTVADMSWNWHGGAGSNTSNTMGFYSYTDNNSGWGFIYVGGSTPYLDRKVVTLYNRVSNGDEYPAFISDNNLKVSNTTDGTPQYFVILDNGSDSNSGEPMYNLMVAEANGKYLTTSDPATNTLSTTAGNYLFLNGDSKYKSYYEENLKDGHALATSPYYNFLAKNDYYRTLHSKCDGNALNGWSNNYNSSYKIQFFYAAKGSWNGLWTIKEQSYTVWKVVNTTNTTGGALTYNGTLLTGATAKQSNGGYFVIASATTPTSSDFTPDAVNGYYSEVTIDTYLKLIKVAYTNCSTEYTAITDLLSTTPETVGYPNATARTTLQNAINTFDSSPRTKTDFTTLTTAKTTFQTTTNVNIPEEGKVYTIQSFINKNTDKLTYLKNESGTFTISKNASETSLNNLWIARSSEDKIVFQSAADFTKYLTYDTGLGESGTTWAIEKGSAHPYIAMKSNMNNVSGVSQGDRYVACDGLTQFGISGGSNYYAGSLVQSDSYAWSTDFKLLESTDYKLITYNLKWNGSTIATQEGVLAQIGAAPVSPWDAPAYCDFTYDVATVAAGTTAVNVTLNWDGPFTISSDFNTATWYYMTNNNIHYLYHSSEGVDGYKVLITDDNLSGAGINAMWAFVGNPYGGIRVINLGAGSGKYLNLNTKAEMVEATYPVYSLCEIIEGTNYFKLKNGDFYLTNHNNSGLDINDSEAWYNSTWAQYQVSAVDFKTLALDFIDDYANDHALGHYFGVATSTYNTVRAMYEDAPSVSASDYTTLIAYIGSYLPASYPETGYYRIKSNSGRYIGYGQPEADPMPSVGLRTVSAEDAAKDASTVIRLVKGVGSHQYTMITEALNVQSMVTGNTPFPATSGAGAVFTLAAETPGKGTIRDPESNDTDDSDENYIYRNGYLHEADWTVPGVVNWDAGAASSQWEIEDATDLTITLNSVGGKSYATFSAPFPVTIGGGAKAYIIETLDLVNNRAIYSEIASKQIPAGAGILLISDTNASSVTATISGSDFDELTGNLLVGYNLAPSFSYPDVTTDWNLVLGNSNTTGIGFYKMNGTATPNKAYLPYPHEEGTLVKGFSLISADDLETGIEDIKAKQQNEAVYDLSGRRVINPKRGLYITKGQKFVR